MIAPPRTDVVTRAFHLAKRTLSEPIFAHSVRVAVFAQDIAEHEAAATTRDLVWVAALLHDLGTGVGASDPVRFEVAGADAAARFLRSENGLDESSAREVWDAVALHTSPHIAERRGGLTRVIRLAVRSDFGGGDFTPRAGRLRTDVEREWPRLDIERVLSDTVVAQAVDDEVKAPAGSWPHDLLAAHRVDPQHPGPNPAF